jgi:FXSXX-COOH protein
MASAAGTRFPTAGPRRIIHSISRDALDIISRDVMILQELELRSAIPDLRDLSLDQLARLGDSVLACSIATYLHRLEDNGMVLSAFNSSI